MHQMVRRYEYNAAKLADVERAVIVDTSTVTATRLAPAVQSPASPLRAPGRLALSQFVEIERSRAAVDLDGARRSSSSQDAGARATPDSDLHQSARANPTPRPARPAGMGVRSHPGLLSCLMG
jgi:hypothetical protein